MFSLTQRQAWLENLAEQEVDVVIIGGGITGAGIFLQAAASGLSVVLLEMQDFAAGTSSRSTKLVHGGIRYLKTFDVEIVADTVKERAVLQEIAPHIPRPAPMLMPIFDEPGSTFDLFSLSVAMDIYDNLAELDASEWANYLLTASEVMARLPQLRRDKLVGGGVYLDYVNDDARLVLENIKQGVADGGMALSRVRVDEIRHSPKGLVNGVAATDLLSGEQIIFKSQVVVNAAGPFVDRVLATDKLLAMTHKLRPTKGVHLVMSAEKLTLEQPLYFDSGENDGRLIFVIPRSEKIYFGTTDTDYAGDLQNPSVEQADVDYLLKIMNARFVGLNLTLADIQSSWAGVRPLIVSESGSDYNGEHSKQLTDESFAQLVDVVKDYLAEKTTRQAVEQAVATAKIMHPTMSPSTVSRGSELSVERDGLITMAGGKLTDYRLMATDVMEELAQLFAKRGRILKRIDSKFYPVSGGRLNPKNVEAEMVELTRIGQQSGLTAGEAREIAERYGSNAPQVFAQKVAPQAGLTLAQTRALIYALDNEMVLTPVDYFWRRTSDLVFAPEKVHATKDAVIEVMAHYFNWSEKEKAAQHAELTAALETAQLHHLKMSPKKETGVN